ncbi:AbiH family protein [Sphingobacterium cellulitidis]|uniref:AbiH family protein n=1 Tax=Sphingobacterium cellulitidis TaxID=1768011 RepID=UPI003C7E2BC8
MNRLILLGNGFDLAHGLKTSYKDFIFWYLDECFNNAGIYANGYFYNDELIRVEVLEHYRLMDLAKNAGDLGISRYLNNNKILKLYLDYDPKWNYVSSTNIEKYRYISEISAHHVSFNSNFFKLLIDTCLDCGWVDIEQEYFQLLKSYKDNDGKFESEKVRFLNKEFEYLKKRLEEYLTLQNDFFEVNSSESLLKDFIQNFKINEVNHDVITSEVTEGQSFDFSENVFNQTVYVLNFNYTNTFKPYLKQIQEDIKFKVIIENHIHGQLKDHTNPIIFGFGDEHNKDYLQFEEQDNNDVFEHVKSYHYLKTSNYSNLIRFLNQGKFRVFILGHSCGLSDRTMFKEIFDHENCKSVRVFHYTDPTGKNDFFDKTINLGRHFSDKGRMRKLVVNFNEADAIPQMK